MTELEHEYLLDFERKLDAVIGDGADVLARVRETSIQWPGDLWALRFLSQLVGRETDTIVEIGSHMGGSMLWMAWCFRPRRIICIDPHAGCSGPADEVRAAFAVSAAMARERIGCEVELLQTTSDLAAPELLDGSAELIYVDGWHSEDVVSVDLVTYWPKVRRGGLLAGHDYCDFHPDHKGVVRAVNHWDHEAEVVLLAPSRVFAIRKPE